LIRVSFVVRVIQDQRGEVYGVIERVATGAKEMFTGAEAIGQMIFRMLSGEGNLPRAGRALRSRGVKRGPRKCPPRGPVQEGAGD
jgi:hypothetical protein